MTVVDWYHKDGPGKRRRGGGGGGSDRDAFHPQLDRKVPIQLSCALDIEEAAILVASEEYLTIDGLQCDALS